jgi:methionine-rich copper-binding protein CopC
MFVRAALVLGSLLAVTLPARSALAHPKLVSASPAANASVEQSPALISATFNETLTLSLSKLTLIDAAQRAIPLEATKAAEGDPKTLTARVTVALKPGRYTAKWQAAGADGHPMRGEFTFLVVAPSGAGPSPKPPAR